MTTLIASTLFALAILGLATYFQIARRKYRHVRLSGLELRPNCLLTRYPIAFISGRPSIFHLFGHWNEVPNFLREHGYDVLTIEPNPKNRQASLIFAFDEIGKKCHVIADSSSSQDLEFLARSRHKNIGSLTWVRNSRGALGQHSEAVRASDLRPLDTAIEIFNIEPSTPLRRDWREKMASLLLWAHNFLRAHLGSRRGRFVDAIETCHLESTKPWDLESHFLDLAISLAERDAQWCD